MSTSRACTIISRACSLLAAQDDPPGTTDAPLGGMLRSRGLSSTAPHPLRALGCTLRIPSAAALTLAACSFTASSALPPSDAGPDTTVPDGSPADAPPDASLPDGPLPDAGLPPDLENADRLFDLTQLHTFDIEVAPADWEWLNANALLEQYRPATVIFEGRRYEGAGVRFKGSYNTLESCFDSTGTRICPKLSIKLKFNEYISANRFKGLRKLNFNSSIRDPTLMHEVISYYLFRSMGIAAPRASHALVNVNGEPQGLFVMVEDVDQSFLKDHWSTDAGNLYKSVWPQYLVSPPYIAALETNKSTPDVSRMLALAQIARQSTDATFVADVATKLDLPSLAKFLAVDRAVFSDDGVQIFYCSDATTEDCKNNNYYWYEVPGGVTQLIPWDVDYTLADINVDLGRSQWDTSAAACTPVPYCDYFTNEVGCNPAAHEEYLLRPQCDPLFGHVHRATWNAYRLALRQLADGPMSTANLLPLIAGVRAKIRPAVIADTHGPGLAVWRNNLDWLVDVVLPGQLAEIERLLAEPAN